MYLVYASDIQAGIETIYGGPAKASANRRVVVQVTSDGIPDEVCRGDGLSVTQALSLGQ